VDKVVNIDLDSFNSQSLDGETFDLIILADVLEHTKNPSAVLCEILKSATVDAEVIISLPNIQHWTAIKNLMIGRWPQLERGLFDKTHLRFFTLRSIHELLSGAGLQVEAIKRNYRIVDSPGGKVNRLSKLFALGPLKPFLTYQYVLRARLANLV
jgi:2-polyprenyl-3-methyl-5-hydroxy-6-metoxy-1,4-benzoquinol methylase